MLTEPRDRVPRGEPAVRGSGPRVPVVPDAGERLRRAVVEHAVIEGLENVVVGRLCTDAGVSRRTFYDRYASVLDLFRDVYGTLDDELRVAIDGAVRRADDRADAVVGAIVRFACLDRVRAEALFVQAPTAGAEVAARRDATLRWCAALVAGDDDAGVAGGGLGSGASAADLATNGLGAEIAWHGVWSIVSGRVADGDFVGLRRLQPELVAAVRTFANAG